MRRIIYLLLTSSTLLIADPLSVNQADLMFKKMQSIQNNKIRHGDFKCIDETYALNDLITLCKTDEIKENGYIFEIFKIIAKPSSRYIECSDDGTCVKKQPLPTIAGILTQQDFFDKKTVDVRFDTDNQNGEVHFYSPMFVYKISNNSWF